MAMCFLGTSFQHCVGQWTQIPQQRCEEERRNAMYFIFSTSMWTEIFKKIDKNVNPDQRHLLAK